MKYKHKINQSESSSNKRVELKPWHLLTQYFGWWWWAQVLNPPKGNSSSNSSSFGWTLLTKAHLINSIQRNKVVWLTNTVFRSERLRFPTVQYCTCTWTRCSRCSAGCRWHVWLRWQQSALTAPYVNTIKLSRVNRAGGRWCRQQRCYRQGNSKDRGNSEAYGRNLSERNQPSAGRLV